MHKRKLYCGKIETNSNSLKGGVLPTFILTAVTTQVALTESLEQQMAQSLFQIQIQIQVCGFVFASSGWISGMRLEAAEPLPETAVSCLPLCEMSRHSRDGDRPWSGS